MHLGTKFKKIVSYHFYGGLHEIYIEMQYHETQIPRADLHILEL